MPVPVGYSAGPSCLSRAISGFVLGGLVGSAFGILIGGYMCLKHGLRGMPLLVTVGKNALQSGGAFGGFMAVGSVIRCDDGRLVPNPNANKKTRTLLLPKRINN